MSCVLEFFDVDLEVVKKFFAAGDSQILDAVVADGELIFKGSEDDEEMREEKFVWTEIVRSLSGGDLGKYLSTQKPLGNFGETDDLISETKSLAMASVIKHLGQSIAGVFHSMSSGEMFRREPFEYLNRAGFLGPINSFLLLQRPFFNQTTLAIPGFGGLTRAELAAISMDELIAAVPSSGDTDIDSWASGILNMLEDAKLHELDLITIYH